MIYKLYLLYVVAFLHFVKKLLLGQLYRKAFVLLSGPHNHDTTMIQLMHVALVSQPAVSQFRGQL